jgi:hypothetical protein
VEVISMPARSGSGRNVARRTAAPGSSLIEGGFRDRTDARRGTRQRPDAGRRTRHRSTARVAAPLLVPLALALTLGIILAVSAGSAPRHVNQQTTGTSATNSARP